VLYSHFAGKDAIVTAIALEGFAELAIVLRTAHEHASADASNVGASDAEASDAGASNTGASDAGASDAGARAVAEAYLDFARAHPAVYDAMFAEPTSLAFATEETPQPLLDGFAALLKVVGDETYAEVFWSALHGLASLERGRRLRRDQAAQRLDVLVEKMAPGTGPGAVVSG
jgi:AcrR family transcriptional regulator